MDFLEYTWQLIKQDFKDFFTPFTWLYQKTKGRWDE